jgi:proteasome lid subunit RPN8/RPN11
VKVYGIKRATLKMAMEVAKDTYPKEFAAMMRALDGVITELLFLPGTIGADRSATIPLYMKPIDFSIVGSIHSHPSTNMTPSQADLAMFSRTGDVHIIVAYPYTMESWRAYDRMGNPKELELI